MQLHDLIAVLGILAGMVGIVTVVLPGLVLIIGASWVWGIVEGGPLGWTVAVLVTLVGIAGIIVKFLVPGRRLKDHGLPTRHLLIALGAATVGFFVIPVVGAFVAFVLSIYLLELRRVGRDTAWASSVQALKAIGLSVGIELFAGFIMAVVLAVAMIFG